MEHTKEEFFHTFNTLQQSGKQIVLSSDNTPHELRGMEERLRQRFESGLVADITAPEYETRLSILENRAKADNLVIPSDVLAYIASMIQSNIRSLGGAMIRLSAYASMHDLPISKELAREVLAGFFIEHRKFKSEQAQSDCGASDDNQSPLRQLPLPDYIAKPGSSRATDRELFDHIINQVSDHFGIDKDYIAGDGSAATSRRREISGARQIAMFLAREHTHLKVAELGELFGGVNHSAVTHAHSKMAKQMTTEPHIISDIQAIKKKMEI
jgi:chromosomal replication initiator protein